MPPRDRDESRRAIARRERRDAGDRSSRIARNLMQWKDASLAKLQIDAELRDQIETARAITSQIARRRAERALAGYLRGVDLDELEAYMIKVEANQLTPTRLFHAAEKWRTRLIEEGVKAAEEFPGGNVDPLPKLVDNAKRERDTGKPPGAARALFRHVIKVLEAQQGPAAAAKIKAADSAPADDDDADDDADDTDDDETDDES